MKKIFVIGSLNMDMVFQIPGIPKCGETVMGNGFFMNSGGKGANQAVACARQNAETVMVGTVGSDVFGEKLIKDLKASGVNAEYVRNHSMVPTGTALILINENNNRIVVVAGANRETLPIQIEEALVGANQGDVLLTQMEIPYESVAFALKRAKEKGLYTILNPAPAQPLDDTLLSKVDLVVPNETEAEKISGIPLESVDFTEKSIQYFLKRGVKEVVITLGASGCVYGKTNTTIHIPAFNVPIVDTTAAGDTFVGSLGVAVASGYSVVSALPRANAAAALAISKMGAQCSIPNNREIDMFLDQHSQNGGPSR
jgi:ribokinase